jgi:hypothetical protein
MQSRILKISTLLCALAVGILISSCERKSDPKNQITIIINSVDGNTKENRVNMFDTIEVRVERFGFPKKKYVKVAEYTTDSAGAVSVKLDRNEAYLFMLGGKSKFFGSRGFSKGDLKDGQEVNLEVDSVEYR